MVRVKRCPRCQVVKPLDQFPPRKDRPSGVMSRCHECDKLKARAFYAANRKQKAAYYKANRDRIGHGYRALRAQSIEIYGSRCARCGKTENLEFDHVDWDGSEHRKVEQSLTLYRRIVRAGRPITDYRLRLLCRRCHWARLRKRPKAKVHTLTCEACRATFVGRAGTRFCATTCRKRAYRKRMYRPAQPGVLTYTSMHAKVRRLRGLAGAHDCQCGQAAEQWAYDHSDPDELSDPAHGPYSLSVKRYIPLCRACHTGLDRT